MSRARLEEAEVTARKLAKVLDAAMPVGWGFMLFLSSFGPDGFSTYVSSMNREDAIRAMEEWIARVKSTGFGDDETEPACWCCSGKGPLIEYRGHHRSVRVCHECHGRRVSP